MPLHIRLRKKTELLLDIAIIMEHVHRRYQTAVKVVESALKDLQENNLFCDGSDVITALKQIYTDEATYKMIKIKKYVNDNGYSNAILSKVNIDTPKIPKS